MKFIKTPLIVYFMLPEKGFSPSLLYSKRLQDNISCSTCCLVLLARWARETSLFNPPSFIPSKIQYRFINLNIAGVAHYTACVLQSLVTFVVKQ